MSANKNKWKHSASPTGNDQPSPITTIVEWSITIKNQSSGPVVAAGIVEWSPPVLPIVPVKETQPTLALGQCWNVMTVFLESSAAFLHVGDFWKLAWLL